MKNLAKRQTIELCALTIALLSVSRTVHADLLGDISANFSSALTSDNTLLTLGLVYLAGLATALTPCVYPMIAITVSVFGAKQASSRREAALLSSCYVLGMVSLFVPLGILSSVSGFAFGAALSSPIVISFMAAFFFAMALSMFGVFDLSLPSKLQNKLATLGGRGYKGAFTLGLVGGLIAGPCTGPVLAVLLTWLSTTGNIAFGALSLLFYGLGLGTLFWFVGTFAMTLPKSGRWMESVKSLFGICMIFLGLFFLKPFYQDTLGPFFREVSVWILGALIVLGLMLGALHLSFFSMSWMHRIRKTKGIIFILAGLLGVIVKPRLFDHEASIMNRPLSWSEKFSTITKMNHPKQPMIIDFTAEWCGACKEFEHEVLEHPKVQKSLVRYKRVKVDLSAGEATDEKWDLLRSYNQPGLPFVVVHESNGKIAKKITGKVQPGVFAKELSKVP